MATDGTGGGFALTDTAITGNIISIGHTEHEYEEYETSHLGTTGGRTFQPTSLYNPGMITLEVLFEPDAAGGWGGLGHTSGTAHDQSQVCTITYPYSFGGSGTKATLASAGGFIKGVEYDIVTEERLVARFMVRLSGNLTYSAEGP